MEEKKKVIETTWMIHIEMNEPRQQIPAVQVFWLSITNNLNRWLFILLVLFVQGGNIFSAYFQVRNALFSHSNSVFRLFSRKEIHQGVRKLEGAAEHQR